MKTWLVIRCLYYLLNIFVFSTFPSLMVPNMMPTGMIFLCYMIAGLFGLLFILDVKQS